MKVCFLDFNNNYGGASQGSISLARNIRNAGVYVTIYDAYGKNKNYHDEIKKNNIPVRVLAAEAKETFIGGDNQFHRFFRLIKQLPLFTKLAFRLRRALKQDKIEIIWFNNHKSFLLAIIACYGLGIKKVLYHRGEARPRDFKLLYRNNVKLWCSAIITHSYVAAKNLSLFFPKKKIVKVPNGISLNTAGIREREINRPNFTVCLPAARPVYEKGYDVAIEAIHILNMRGYKDISLVLTGKTAVGHSNEYLKILKKLVTEYSLNGRVKFIGWIDDMPNLLVSCDVVVLPSHSEGFPRVIIESMLVGTPVITTAVGGLPEAVFDGITGYLIKIGDAEALADKIETLYLNPNLYDKISKNAKEAALKQFSPTIQTEKIINLFNSILLIN